MLYKLYRYSITDDKHRVVGPDRHYDLFLNCRGIGGNGLATYRGQRDAILMYISKFRSDFAGLIGKYSTEREVTTYNNKEDIAERQIVDDEDYPNAPFIAFPRLGFIAVSDSGQIKADSAIDRLNRIIAHRTKWLFVAEAFREPIDLRKATKNFKVTEVTFEVLPVNPHTGDLGRKLDEDRALDHIRKITGKLSASPAQPLELKGGFLTQIQQLQQSGHCRVGFKAETNLGVEIQVPKPRHATELDDDEQKVVIGEEANIRIQFNEKGILYPVTEAHVGELRAIIRHLTKEEDQQ